MHRRSPAFADPVERLAPNGDVAAASNPARRGTRPIGAARGLHDLPAKADVARSTHFGSIRVALRQGAQEDSIACRAGDGQAFLLIPLSAPAVRIAAEGVQLACAPGQIAILSTMDGATATFAAGGTCLVALVASDQLNIAMSLARGDAYRLMRVAAVVDSDILDETIEAILRLLGDDNGHPRGDQAVAEAEIYAALATLLTANPRAASILSRVRAVGEAMALVRKELAQPFDTSELAALVGVTAQTLRKGFRACLGMSVKEYIEVVRLQWAHGRLSSGRDGRPISALARLAGYAQASPFSRAYVKRFGEPPSQTRANAVKVARYQIDQAPPLR